MFDDPQKHLKWMEEALLEEEKEDDTELSDYADYPDEDWEKILEEDWDFTQPPASNPALNFSRAFYEDELFTEDVSLPVHQKGRAAKMIDRDQKKEEHRQKKKDKKKNKGIGGLVILALLELLGIFAIIGWWIQWLT